MDIGSAVYLVTDRQTTGAGVPAVIRDLYEKSARIAIEREEGTKIFDVRLWDLFPRGHTRRRSCESVTRPGKPWIGKGELRARCGKRTWSRS
jgi:hypothetical protein